MLQVNYSDIIIATIAAFIFSAVYYMIVGKRAAAAQKAYRGKEYEEVKMTPVVFIVEFVRTFIVGLVIAYAIAMLNLLYIQQALLLAFWLWIGFPVVLLVGSVIHEKYPVRLAVIHAIDWLVKLLIFAVILTMWR